MSYDDFDLGLGKGGTTIRGAFDIREKPLEDPGSRIDKEEDKGKDLFFYTREELGEYFNSVKARLKQK